MAIVRLWTAGRDFTLTNSAIEADQSVVRALSVAALASRQQATSDGSQTEAEQDGTAESAGPLVDPVDAAVLRAARRANITRAHLVQQRPALGIVPFSSERKFMASFHDVDGRVTAFAKGAPRRILSMCGRVAAPDGERDLDDAARSALMATNNAFAERGLRVLAIASGPVPDISESALRGLTFVGFLGLADPPAAGVLETIARLRTAGLETVMLTGDQRLTAEAIGRELGLLGPDDHAMDGRGLDALTGADLDLKIRQHF
jgi:Ca2+-transporting ATPase